MKRVAEEIDWLPQRRVSEKSVGQRDFFGNMCRTDGMCILFDQSNANEKTDEDTSITPPYTLSRFHPLAPYLLSTTNSVSYPIYTYESILVTSLPYLCPFPLDSHTTSLFTIQTPSCPPPSCPILLTPIANR